MENLIDDKIDVLSSAAIELVKDLIKVDPKERLSAKEALDSKWMKVKVRASEPLADTSQSLRQRMLLKKNGCKPDGYER